MAQDKLPEPGEFTRMFKRQQMKAHNPNGPLEPEPPLAAPTPPAATDSTPSSSGPGEFTQYFSNALPAKRASSPPTRSPANVQRPGSPVPRPVSSDSSGSFSERFGNGPASQAKAGGLPDLARPSGGSSNPFDLHPSVPNPPSAEHSDAGEFTQLFGPNARPPEPQQTVVVQPYLEPMMNDSPRFPHSSSTPMPTDAGAAPEKNEPSDFSKALNARPQAPAAAAPSPSGRPVAVNISAANPFGSLPSMQMPTASANMQGAHVASPFGAASVAGPSAPHIAPPNLNLPPAQIGAGMGRLSDQSKLIIFFAALAILAVILVVALVVTQKA